MGMDSALSLARAGTERLRRVLRPGLTDAVSAMLDSDVESAETRVAWLRARLEAEAKKAL